MRRPWQWADALYGGATVGNEDMNYPIPQRQIDLMRGTLFRIDNYTFIIIERAASV